MELATSKTNLHMAVMPLQETPKKPHSTNEIL